MLLFSKAKLVLLCVPKTGTTAYQTALGPHAAMVVRDPPELKHAPVFRYNRFYRPALEKFIGTPLDIVAVMREPVDWLGSWYRYRRRPFTKGQRTSTHDVTFDEFIDAYTRGDKPPFANVGSQAKFLEPQKNGTAVTHLFRYDDQDGLRKFLQDRLGVTFDTGRENASPDMSLALSAETETKLRRKCADEFTLWEGIGENGAYRPLPAP
ncbi:gamma-glutamyl kinase [Roseovarius gahaiensis]|uniref:Gamma-glutamyl kinase n=1 Tax=Roseovarius gahaiensis TaxID=2716691 RepID=A0A967BAI9_9RHOB|nr:gamma-glutamyl kinase [Roseovarius gahaiensis]NHQ73060.1 gamma-glutamyl kinase [Roseovarius gahaiensis]